MLQKISCAEPGCRYKRQGVLDARRHQLRKFSLHLRISSYMLLVLGMSAMTKRDPVQPTTAELAILRALWDLGPSTVRQVHERLQSNRAHSSRKTQAYTTTLKFLQIMIEKKLVIRDERDRSHIYRPAVSEGQTQRRLLRDLLDRAFGGSMHKLVMHALSAKPATRAELEEIRKLIDGLKG